MKVRGMRFKVRSTRITRYCLWLVLACLPVTFVAAQKVKRTRFLNWQTHVSNIPQGDAFKITVNFKTNDPIYYGIRNVKIALCKDRQLKQPFMIECYRDSGEPMTAFTDDKSMYVMRNTFVLDGKGFEERTYFIPFESMSKYYWSHQEELGNSNEVTAYINTIITLNNGKVLENMDDGKNKPASITWRWQPAPVTHAEIIDLRNDDISGLFDEEEEPCLDILTAGLDLMQHPYGEWREIMEKHEIGTCKHKADIQSLRAIRSGVPDTRHNNQILMWSIYSIDRDRCYEDDCLINVEVVAGNSENQSVPPSEVNFRMTRGFDHVCNFAASLAQHGFTKTSHFTVTETNGKDTEVTIYRNGKYDVEVATYSPQNIRVSISKTPPAPPEMAEQQNPEHKHQFKTVRNVALCNYAGVSLDAYQDVLNNQDTLTVELDKVHQVKMKFRKIRPGETKVIAGITLPTDSMISATPLTKALWVALFPEPENNRGYSLSDTTPLADLPLEDRLMLLERLAEKAGLGEYIHFHIARAKLLSDYQKTSRGAESEEEEKWYGSLTEEGELYLVAVPQKKIETYTKLKQLSCMKCSDPKCGEVRSYHWWPLTFATHQQAQNFLDRIGKEAKAKGERVVQMDCEELRKCRCF